jgi:hypothetical protein
MFRGTVKTKGDVNGNTFKFILGPTADMAVERGSNGDIPLMADNQTNAECTLKEYHHLVQKNRFNINSSSVDQRMIMQQQGIASMNKRTDDLIITELATTAYDSGAAAAASSIGWLLEAQAILGENDVPVDDGAIWCALTPMAHAQLLRTAQASSSDYIDERPFMKMRKIREIAGVKVFRSTALPGSGSASASCFMWHEDAVGHAMQMGEQNTAVDYESKHDRSWARTSSYQGAKMLQDEGVFKIVHNDDSALV